MLRLSELVRDSLLGREKKPFRGLILIWNLTNRCNLHCAHCYSSASGGAVEELTQERIREVIEDLKREKVRYVILSGGEPLLRKDIFDIARTLKDAGFKTSLSTNGLLIEEDNVQEIKKHFDYVGISIDGTPEVHDAMRGRKGSFQKSLRALVLCMERGIKTGLRFTLTERTAGSLPFIFGLALELGVQRLYISHLVFSGRGAGLRGVERDRYREVSLFVVQKAIELVERGAELDVVTGNNETDAVLLLKEFGRMYPERRAFMYELLRAWGGNQAGVRLANIDHRGNVKPDPFFFHTLGNLKEKSFSRIWNSGRLLARLREKPRRISGKCGICPYIEICNGNSRARAYSVYGDYFAEDPACYL